MLPWQWKKDTYMWSTWVLILVAIWTIHWFVLVSCHWFVLVSSHQWLAELLCFPAYNRWICWAFQFRIDLSNECIYESGFLKSYSTVKQLISKKSVAVILDESLAQEGRAGLLECLTHLFQTPCWVTSGMKWGVHASVLIFKALCGPFSLFEEAFCPTL